MADFIGNSTTSGSGGAIYNNEATIGDITGDFIGNSATTGGAISNGADSTKGIIKGDFINNSVSGGAAKGGAIYNISGWSEYYGNVYGIIKGISGNFVGNNVTSMIGEAYGGAIYNEGRIGEEADHSLDLRYPEQYSVTLTNASFINNSAVTDSGTAKGGAIYAKSDVKLIADNGVSVISGNYVKDADGERSNAIYMAPITAGFGEVAP